MELQSSRELLEIAVSLVTRDGTERSSLKLRVSTPLA